MGKIKLSRGFGEYENTFAEQGDRAVFSRPGQVD
jgi:hypothetical protein